MSTGAVAQGTHGAATVMSAVVSAASVGTIETLNDLVKAAQEICLNGHLTFGFVMQTDPGLSRAEYVVVPHGVTPGPFSTRETKVDDTSYSDAFLECLFADAHVVEAKVMPRELKPFVAASRAHSYAAGYLSVDDKGEVVPAPAAFSDDDKSALMADHPHIAAAATTDLQRGTLPVFCCALNFWQSNHNTCGPVLPKGHIRAVRVAWNLPEHITDAHITSAVYFAGHASDKRLVLRSILDETNAGNLREVRVFRPTVIADKDAWAAIRTGPNMLPAGCAVLGLLRVVLDKVAKCGLIGFSPAPAAVELLASAVSSYKANPGSFHPGAAYLFDCNVTTLSDIEDLKGYLAIFGGFCSAAGLCPTVTTVPHIRQLIAERNDPKWLNLGKMFAKGVDISKESMESAAAAYGVTTGGVIPDPKVDSAGYKVAADAICDRLNALVA